MILDRDDWLGGSKRDDRDLDAEVTHVDARRTDCLDLGVVQARPLGGRTVFAGSRKRIERLLEDARATIARWE